MRSLTLAILVTWISGNASASVVVNIEPAAGADLASELGISIDDLEAQLSEQVTAAFGLATPKAYVRALADAQAFSNKGLGVDYASNPTLFVAGLSGNFAMALGEKGFGEYYSDRPVVGVSPNVSMMGGLNFGFLGFDWLTLYGNFFAQGSKIEQFNGNLFNYGVHAQAKLFRPEGDAVEFIFQWGGLDITTGFEYSRLDLKLKQPLTTPAHLEGDSEISTAASFKSDGTYTIATSAMSVPFELSTNVRLLYFVTIFLGVGYDIQVGEASMKLNLEGELGAENPTDGSEVDLGSVSIEATEKSEPSGGMPRVLAGVQVNVSFLKVFVQLNAMLPDRGVSAGAGVRVAW
jgi:hypothetical protein